MSDPNHTPLTPAERQQAVAEIIVQAVNMALAGLNRPLATPDDARYYAERIMELFQ
jgi:hypothetical protein